MGFLDRLKNLFSSGPARDEPDVLFIYARCDRCKQVLRGRIDRRNELGRSNGGFTWRKELMGTGKNRCFQRIEVILEFDDQRQITEQRIYGGKFITAEEYEAEIAKEAATGSA
ncbi:MAG: hypothetical protein IT330_11110 [Anaerolineae bacterium]|nr:hypothetical protein [Anaerolineae bacterium]